MTQTEQAASVRATRDATAWVQYLEVWERRLKKLQRRHPERWRVRGWSEEEVRDALTLHLFEAVQGAEAPPSDRADAPSDGNDMQCDGDAWALDVLARRVRELQRSSRLNVVVMDLSDTPLLQREPSHEEFYLEREDDNIRRTAAERARESLNQPQRRWLAALQWTANRGDFFESSERPNLSAAARVIGKDRSSAARAYQELQARFQQELKRSEGALGVTLRSPSRKTP